MLWQPKLKLSYKEANFLIDLLVGERERHNITAREGVGMAAVAAYQEAGKIDSLLKRVQDTRDKLAGWG